LSISAAASEDDWKLLLNAPTSVKGAWAEGVLETRVIALGFIPCRPCGIPAPYDFIIEREGLMWRVQVKSAWQDKNGCWVFRTTGGSADAPTYTPERVDVLACLVVPLKTWYIIPVAEVEEEQERLIVTPEGAGKSKRRTKSYEAFRERWDLLEVRG
jgi:hypothetical protein